MPIANNVRHLLQSNHEGLRPLARTIGVSYTTIFDLYHDRTSAISFELLDKLCQHFQVTPNDIFPFSPSPLVLEQEKEADAPVPVQAEPANLALK